MKQEEDFCTYYSSEQFSLFFSTFQCGTEWQLVSSPCGTLSIRWYVNFDRLKELCFGPYKESLWLQTEYEPEFAFEFTKVMPKGAAVERRPLMQTYLGLYPQHQTYIQDLYNGHLEWINPAVFSQEEFNRVFEKYDKDLEWAISHQIFRN